MKAKVLICILLITTLLLGGCQMSPEQLSKLIGDEKTEEVTLPVESFYMAYNIKLPLDPFLRTSSQNEQVAKLCYEPLFMLDQQLRTFGLLASGVEKVTDIEYMVLLNADRKFWDNSPVSVSDVLFSFQKAKLSENYMTILSGITSMTEASGKIKVTLAAPDAHFMNNLSFPIIKQYAIDPTNISSDNQTSSKETSQIEKIKIDYIGTGLYHPYFGENITLKLNTSHPRAAKANVKTIELMDMPDFDVMSYSLDAGVVNVIYSDLANGLLPKISGNLRAAGQNHLVYLGVAPTGATADLQVRKAISTALDRTGLASIFSGYAKACTSPFHPDWYAATGLPNANLTFNIESAKALVNSLKSTGLNPALTIAVNSDNDLRVRLANEIARQLTLAGFTCTVSPLDFASYTKAVTYGGYNLYVGELRMPLDFNLSSLLKSGQSSFGITASQPLIDTLNSFYLTGKPDSFIAAFDTELPFLPLCYRSGLLGLSRSYTIPTQTAFDFAYSDIEQLTHTVKQTSSQVVQK